MVSNKKEWNTGRCYNMYNPSNIMQAKEAGHKEPHVVWVHIFEMSRIGDL